MRAGRVGWQQHKMSVRLGSEPGSNMHNMPCLWLAEVGGVGGPLSICAQTRFGRYILGCTLGGRP